MTKVYRRAGAAGVACRRSSPRTGGRTLACHRLLPEIRPLRAALDAGWR